MKYILLALIFLVPGSVHAQEKATIAVMDLKAKTGIDEMTASMLTDVLCTSIKDMGKYKAISRKDIEAMLSHVKHQQLLGCDDTRCLTEIGGALGVPLLIHGSIGKLGPTYLVNLSLVDIDNAKVVNRISEEFAGNENELTTLIRNQIRVLLEGKRSIKISKVTILRYGMFTAGVATAVISYYVYKSGQNYHDNEYFDAVTAQKEASSWEQLKNYNRNISILLGASGIFIIGGTLTFIF